MQTIFEIFNPVDGKTQGWRVGEEMARRTISRAEPHAILDYLPAEREGFYIVAKGASDIESVKGCYDSREEASRKADFENMASDALTFRVVEHRL